MKRLFNFLALLILISIWGSEFLPELFVPWQPYSALLGFITILLSYAFTKAIIDCFVRQTRDLRDFLKPAWYLFVFICLLTLLISMNHFTWMNYTTFTPDEPKAMAFRRFLSKSAVEAPEVEDRRISASMVYQDIGLIIAWRDAAGDLELYQPTTVDEKEYLERSRGRSLEEEIRQATKFQAKLFIFGTALLMWIFVFASIIITLVNRRAIYAQDTNDQKETN